MWGTPNPVPVLFNIVDPHGYECIEKGRCGSPGSRLLVRLGEYGCWTALSNLLGCLGCQELTVTIPEGAVAGEDLEIPVPMVPRSRQAAFSAGGAGSATWGAIRFEAKK